ncbi:Membrane-bound lytic murein transglycosylase F [bioreactor metagenome]|uniref:Membrane-bound lytic murein transglycosylase F n=1 Tax=bioreactor metagenome TaxID=1076179 RepID=A0A645CXS2_9ZZZZ|nr:transporter substrate-binding domain-containing protein [Proteiniphilum sp.]MEA4917479.1 transporter substrate-binding domain-containing protein [Proteiniphilum sp.]
MRRLQVAQLQSRDYDDIVLSGELNVVTDYNTIGLYASGDTLLGFQREMILALEKEWGIKVNLFLENSLEENLEGLRTMRYDLIARNIPVNIQLKDSFAFTTPIMLNKQVLVQRKSKYNDSVEPIRQHLDLAGRTIHVADDSPVILRLNNLSHEIGDTIFIIEDPTYETEQLVMMVASGDIDLTVCDEKMAIRLAKLLPEIDIETDISFTQLESWAVRKNSPVLLDSLNSWLDRFKPTTTFKGVFKKYY